MKKINESSENLTYDEARKRLDVIEEDLLRPLKNHNGLSLWLLFLGLVIALAGYAYITQLQEGLHISAMRDYVSWGIYISTFVFFVATSLVGMLISAVLGLSGASWITPISRIAEIVAVAFIAVAGLAIIVDMGRPERGIFYVFLYGRFQSPILWDATVILVYTLISVFLLMLPLIPDIALCRRKLTDAPKWQQTLYKLFSFGWVGLPEQYKIIHKSMRTLLILIVPVALGIHTVTSWLFAMTLRTGWDSTIFGPYFVAGAFPAGAGAVIVAMYFFRNNFKLKDYLTDQHFDYMGRITVLVSAVYIYFNLNEYLVPAYKMKMTDYAHISETLWGGHALLFWSVQIFGLVLPTLIMIFKAGRRPKVMAYLGVFIVMGAFLKRYLIVVPTQMHPYLPIQNVSEEFMHYSPTGYEVVITGGLVALVLLIITFFAKTVPIMSVWELAEERGLLHATMPQQKETAEA